MSAPDVKESVSLSSHRFSPAGIPENLFQNPGFRSPSRIPSWLGENGMLDILTPSVLPAFCFPLLFLRSRPRGRGGGGILSDDGDRGRCGEDRFVCAADESDEVDRSGCAITTNDVDGCRLISFWRPAAAGVAFVFDRERPLSGGMLMSNC